MRIVVLGATGNVGTSVVRSLAADDRVSEIVALARRIPDWTAPKTTFAIGDIASDDLTPHFRGADTVIHLAWLFQPTHNPRTTWRVNVEGSQRVFDAVAAAGVGALVYASSVGAYSPGRGMVDESWPTHSLPASAYGREKAYVERLLDVFEARYPKVRAVRMRPAFIFQRASASEQRRLFAGPFVPGFVARPGRLPVLPLPAELRFQALHAEDAADAYCRAATGDARGPFNLAADPVIDHEALGELLDARVVTVPRALVRGAVALAWHARLIPADPALVELFLELPLLDATRARTELGWEPRYSGVDALREMLGGMAEGAGAPTPPLQPDSVSQRLEELADGVGQRAPARHGSSV